MMSQSKIYLDNNATTIIDPAVLDAVIDELKNHNGNPSSTHYSGQDARQRLNAARQAIASFLGVSSRELIFTSGGTEALNLMIQGLFSPLETGHIISSQGEHAAVHNVLKHLETKGATVTYLPIGSWGAVTPQAVQEAICKETKLIVLMAVNNETGVRTDIEAIAEIAQQANVPFIVDGVALLGKEPHRPIPRGISGICYSGHKIHAPKGIGIACMRSHLKFHPLLMGGDQEYKRRPGTENMSGIIALAEAIRVMQQDLPAAVERMRTLRDRFEQSIKAHIPTMIINGTGPRICNTSNLAFPGVDGESLLIALDLAGIAASHGSACTSGALEPSRILLQMGLPLELARSSIRFSLSRFTTEDEINQAIEIITHTIKYTLK